MAVNAAAIVRSITPPLHSRGGPKSIRMPFLISRVLASLTPQRCRTAAILFFVLMVAIGAVPGNAQALSATVHDKQLHFAAYALLSALLYGGLAAESGMRGLRTVAAAGTLGAIDEAMQALLPYREASLADWQVDMIAALVCVVLLSLLTPLYSLFAARSAESGNAPVKVIRSGGRDSP